MTNNEQLLKALNKIDTYIYKYKKEYQDVPGTNDKLNVGILAQELKDNPLTANCVFKDEDGLLKIDTPFLTMTIMGMLPVLSDAILSLEERIKKLEGDR